MSQSGTMAVRDVTVAVAVAVRAVASRRPRVESPSTRYSAQQAAVEPSPLRPVIA